MQASQQSANSSEDHLCLRAFRRTWLTNSFLKLSAGILKDKENVIDA